MKKYLFIIIDTVIVLAVGIGVFVYLKYYSPKPFSVQTTSCTPAESNDCTIHDATVIQGEFKETWKNVSVRLGNIPANSWYKIIQNTDESYEVKFYPHVGKHFILGSHDFTISLKITKTNRASTSTIPPSAWRSPYDPAHRNRRRRVPQRGHRRKRKHPLAHPG
jgi:hypothetical protein